MRRLSLSTTLMLVATSFGFAQGIDYQRIVAGGGFRTSVFWAPFNPAPPPQLGPGGSTDTANFDLGQTLLTTYTINDVSGVNDQLIVHNDSVRLEIDDYELLGVLPGSSIVVGATSGDVGILFLDGGSNAQLNSSATSIALGSGITGSIIVDSPELTWNNESFLSVGNQGIGTLQIRNGQVNSGFSLFGSEKGIGFGTITGPNSFWDVNGSLAIGNSGMGVLVIEDGAHVTSQQGTVGRLFAFSEGTVNIDESGSTWDVNGTLRIGEQGVGIVTVQNGGSLESNDVNIGDTANSDGTLIVEGNSTDLQTSGTVRVGFQGNGSVRVRDGAEAFSPALVIGHQAGSDGSVLVSFGQWITSDDQIIGREGQGFLGVTDAEVICRGDAFIGRFAGSNGLVRVSIDGLWQVENNLVVGGNLNPLPVSGGNGMLTFGSTGACVDILEDLIIVSDGVVNLASGSELSANRIDLVDGGTLNMIFGGILHVDTMLDSLDNEDGILAPGNVPLQSSPIGGTTIDGNYTQQEDGAMQIQVQGVGAGTGYDVVTITGDAFIDGILEVEMLDGFLPLADDTFEVVNLTTGSMFGFFNNIGDDERLETIDGTGSFLVRYGITSPSPDKVILSDFEPGFILGDVNGDGAVNLLDVQPFIVVLTTGPFNPAADINMDGQVNLLDVGPFVALLSGD